LSKTTLILSNLWRCLWNFPYHGIGSVEEWQLLSMIDMCVCVRSRHAGCFCYIY
ncbi:hypothetical protein LSH36_275g09015, partial [Paralvinella palmiformis]